jgi:hypothetical protein
MATVLADTASPSGRAPRRGSAAGVAVDIAVGTVVVVGWVCYRHWGFAPVVTRAVEPTFVSARWWLVNLVASLFLCLPYALALLVWGRGLSGRATGAVVALAAGGYVWAWDQVFQNYVWGSGPATGTSLRVYEWGYLLGVAALVPLAWGLARRMGPGWVLGVAVGPLLAGVLRELQLHWTWWQDRVSRIGPHDHWQAEAAVFAAPLVLAVLTCWAIEARGRRGSQTRP